LHAGGTGGILPEMSALHGRGACTIALLVGSEEPYLRPALRRLLESRGYSVLDHVDAGQPVDVAVVDASSAAVLEADDPLALAVVFLADATDAIQTRALAASRAAHVLHKPFSADALEEVLAAALDRGQ
jgi:hypothetical protein